MRPYALLYVRHTRIPSTSFVLSIPHVVPKLSTHSSCSKKYTVLLHRSLAPHAVIMRTRQSKTGHTSKISLHFKSPAQGSLFARSKERNPFQGPLHMRVYFHIYGCKDVSTALLMNRRVYFAFFRSTISASLKMALCNKFGEWGRSMRWVGFLFGFKMYLCFFSSRCFVVAWFIAEFRLQDLTGAVSISSVV